MFRTAPSEKTNKPKVTSLTDFNYDKFIIQLS